MTPPDPSDDEVERLLAEARGDPAPSPGPQPASAPPPTPAPASPAAAAMAAAAAAEAVVARSQASQAPPEGALDRLLGLREASILTARYVDLKLADLFGTAILILQAPLIGTCISVAFDGEEDSSKALQFVLAMVCVWLGTFSACREVVKERLIFLRERRAGVSVRAYLLSKVVVLSGLAAVQALLLLVTVRRTVHFDGSLPVCFLLLLLTTLAANALGLLLSSMVKSQNSLIALVPIALIPQLIFSEVIIPDPGELVEKIELVMIASWSYDMIHQLPRGEPEWGTVFGSALVLSLFAVGMLVLAGIFLRAQDDE